MVPTILVIDDDPVLRQSLGQFARHMGCEVSEAADGRSGIEVYERERPDLVILDLEMPGLSGLQMLEILRHRDPEATVIILSAFTDVPMVVQAMQLGAEQFLTKPPAFDLLKETVARALEKARFRRQSQFYAQQAGAAVDELQDLRSNPRTAPLAEQIEVLAAGGAPVLLQGETGTGKGWAARLLHTLSTRASAPFVEVNCASLTPTFLESELFGHEKGAFTDAKMLKRGLFEVADGGTLFLDEIGDLAPELQPKLLKALESRTFRRLGGTREIGVDLRFVAATNHDLAAQVRAGRFREDLYYRLAVLPIRMAPLRERGREAIIALASRFLAEQASPGHHRNPTISGPALALLGDYAWPGNARELRNVLERAVLLAGEQGEIRVEHLPAEFRHSLTVTAVGGDCLTLDALEQQHILEALRLYGDNRARTARALGISRVTLYKKLREYGLEIGGRQEAVRGGRRPRVAATRSGA